MDLSDEEKENIDDKDLERLYLQRCNVEGCGFWHVVPFVDAIEHCPDCGAFVEWRTEEDHIYTFVCDECDFGTDDGIEMEMHLNNHPRGARTYSVGTEERPGSYPSNHD